MAGPSRGSQTAPHPAGFEQMAGAGASWLDQISAPGSDKTFRAGRPRNGGRATFVANVKVVDSDVAGKVHMGGPGGGYLGRLAQGRYLCLWLR